MNKFQFLFFKFGRLFRVLPLVRFGRENRNDRLNRTELSQELNKKSLKLFAKNLQGLKGAFLVFSQADFIALTSAITAKAGITPESNLPHWSKHFSLEPK